MSNLAVIENIESEKTDLNLHVDLCAQRYRQLIEKFDEVDQRLGNIIQTCESIRSDIHSMKQNTSTTYLRWAGVVIMLLSGIIGSAVTHILTR